MQDLCSLYCLLHTHPFKNSVYADILSLLAPVPGVGGHIVVSSLFSNLK